MLLDSSPLCSVQHLAIWNLSCSSISNPFFLCCFSVGISIGLHLNNNDKCFIEIISLSFFHPLCFNLSTNIWLLVCKAYIAAFEIDDSRLMSSDGFLLWSWNKYKLFVLSADLDFFVLWMFPIFHSFLTRYIQMCKCLSLGLVLLGFHLDLIVETH